jgi:hypothetical protein
VCLTVREDGSVFLDTQDMGELVEETWGDIDYEFWVEIPASALPKLVSELLRDQKNTYWQMFLRIFRITTVDTQTSELPKLAFELLRNRFMGQEFATDELCAFCKTHDIDHTWDRWA